LASAKTRIIEHLFNARWDPDTGILSRPLVTLLDVSEEIRADNAAHPGEPPLSDRNPANFFKDFIRNKRSANQNWPPSVLERGFTGRQVTGKNACFEFVPRVEDQVDAFPLNAIPGPTETTIRHPIESASLPLASRRLGRNDEPWLVQVLVRLRVIETHLALFSARQVVQVDHLQMSVKLSMAEIDALFLAIEVNREGEHQEVIISCEAKGLRDDILEDQLLNQVRATFGMEGVTQSLVIPIAVKAIAPSLVHVVEFDAVARDAVTSTEGLTIASEAVYEFVPPIPGIGTMRQLLGRGGRMAGGL
jgi:hypothetical protein